MADIIETYGFVVGVRPYGETSSIIDVFTEEAGLIKGYVKGARTQKNAGIYQKGNLVQLTHTRRLSEQLGTIQADLVQCVWHELSIKRLYFKIFNVLCDLKLLILAHHVYEPVIYDNFKNFITFLLEDPSTQKVKEYYVHYLYLVLEQVGYAPDFKRCGVSGVCNELIYVSPKSLKAISRAVGYPYHHKLLLLPEFLINKQANVIDIDIDNGQKLMQLCYNKLLFHPRNLEFSLQI